MDGIGKLSRVTWHEAKEHATDHNETLVLSVLDRFPKLLSPQKFKFTFWVYGIQSEGLLHYEADRCYQTFLLAWL